MYTDEARRARMVKMDIAARGIRNPKVLAAFAQVPREAFVPDHLVEFAYEDSPLPIGEGQTISQPFIVALMTEALLLNGGERVLEIGTGSGYAAAILSRIAGEVFTVERHASLAQEARERLRTLGYDNVHVLHADGTQGWPQHAPYDAIAVAAGGPEVPESLREQLARAGRLVIPVGETPREQHLVREHRTSLSRFEREDLGPVRFVPLVGVEGWSDMSDRATPPVRSIPSRDVATLIAEDIEPFADIDTLDCGSLLERIGGARVILAGEATHGTSEFYRIRAEITKALITRRDVRIVALEADWPDAARVDAWVRHRDDRDPSWEAFDRFPTWMWRNREFAEFAEWLRAWNATREPEERVGVYGLDLYSMHRSAVEVLRYLDRIDPPAAAVARERYGCLTPWQADPATYGRAALSGRFEACEEEVVAMLTDLLEKSFEYEARDGVPLLGAVQNARVVANAERYYRIMYRGSTESWNLRDSHMFETLENLLAHEGDGSRAIVWEHNSHIGDARATEMGARGQHNVGQLARERLAGDAFLIGFGTDHGTVAAADEWDGTMRIMEVRPAHSASYERLFHRSGCEAGFLHLREPRRDDVLYELGEPRLQRAIGVVYRPETELMSHYFQAVLPNQFDEYVWIDETRAVHTEGAVLPAAAP